MPDYIVHCGVPGCSAKYRVSENRKHLEEVHEGLVIKNIWKVIISRAQEL